MTAIDLHRTATGAWVVAENDQWLPGVYASEATARRAATFSDSELVALERVYRIDGEDRSVTMADLDAIA